MQAMNSAMWAMLASTLLLGACSGSHDSTDDEAPVDPQTTLTLHAQGAPEGALGETPVLTMQVSITETLPEALSISYKTTAITATPGEDYIETSGEVELPAGERIARIPVYLVGDDVEEPREQFRVEIETDGPVEITAGSVVATIANDDSACDTPFVQQPNPWLVNGADPLNYAHRGGVIDFPENTLYAYKEVALAGADVLEMDVYQTLDNHLVIIHDLGVDRTTNGTGRIADLTLAELRALDAAYWFVTGEGTPHDADPAAYTFRGMATGDVTPPPGYTAADFRIPTLEEALAAFPDKLLNLELKPDTDGVGNYEAQIAGVLRRYGRFSDVIAASFVDEAAENFKTEAPCVHTSVPLNQATSLLLGSLGEENGMPPVPEHVSFQVPPDTSQIQQVPNGITVVTQDMVDDSHAVGLAVQVWTINQCEQMLELMELGVDAIMTDRPLLLEDLLNQPPEQRSCPASED